MIWCSWVSLIRFSSFFDGELSSCRCSAWFFFYEGLMSLCNSHWLLWFIDRSYFLCTFCTQAWLPRYFFVACYCVSVFFMLMNAIECLECNSSEIYQCCFRPQKLKKNLHMQYISCVLALRYITTRGSHYTANAGLRVTQGKKMYVHI